VTTCNSVREFCQFSINYRRSLIWVNLALAIALVSRWVCAAMACAKCAGKSKHNLLKNAKGRLYYFLVCPTFNFSKSKLSAKPFACPRGKCLLENCRPLFFETQICPGPIATNVSICVRAGLSKPRPVPDTERIKDTKTLDYASTPLDANTLLWVVGPFSNLYHWSAVNNTYLLSSVACFQNSLDCENQVHV
jgi:hypothetical protein